MAWYVNAAVAKRAPIQMGTQRWPYSTPQRAYPYVSEGDTIHIGPGINDYETASDENVDYSELVDQINVGVIIQGDTINALKPVLELTSSPSLDNALREVDVRLGAITLLHVGNLLVGPDTGPGA